MQVRINPVLGVVDQLLALLFHYDVCTYAIASHLGRNSVAGPRQEASRNQVF